MQLNPSEISELLKKRIEGLGVSADLRTQGTVVSLSDGIARIHGLSDVMHAPRCIANLLIIGDGMSFFCRPLWDCFSCLGAIKLNH